MCVYVRMSFLSLCWFSWFFFLFLFCYCFFFLFLTSFLIFRFLYSIVCANTNLKKTINIFNTLFLCLTCFHFGILNLPSPFLIYIYKQRRQLMTSSGYIHAAELFCSYTVSVQERGNIDYFQVVIIINPVNVLVVEY